MPPENKKSVFERVQKLPPDQLEVLITLLADATAAAVDPPPGSPSQEDLYMALHKDVRRLLVELGQEENKEVRLWLLSLDKEWVTLQAEMVKDYKNARLILRLIKAFWLAILGPILYALFKAAPEVIEWLRTLLLK